jgi:hypothetical protein
MQQDGFDTPTQGPVGAAHTPLALQKWFSHSHPDGFVDAAKHEPPLGIQHLPLSQTK